MKDEWKLEYIAARLGGGEKAIEDFPRFADHFAHLFGDDYILRLETFGVNQPHDFKTICGSRHDDPVLRHLRALATPQRRKIETYRSMRADSRRQQEWEKMVATWDHPIGWC